MLGSQQHKFSVNFDSARNFVTMPTLHQYPVVQPSSALANPITPVNLSWSVVDNICVPCVVRNGKLFVPVRVIEQKLLHPLMAVYPTVASTIKRPLLTSYYMTPGEAETLKLRTSHTGSPYVSGVDLVVSFDEFRTFYAELKSLCRSAIESASNHTGGWVQINNSVIPYVSIDGGKYLPLSVVQNAARLLNNADRSALSVRRLSPGECRLMNDLCHSAGLLFVVDQSTEVIDILTVCGMAHRTPVVRFLPSEDPFGCAQFMDVPEDAEEQLDVAENTKQPTNGLCLPISQSVTTSNCLKIVDVRGNVGPVHPGTYAKASTVVNQFMQNQLSPDESLSGFGQLPNAAVHHPIVETVVFQDRTVSSLRRENGKNYILLEAICRVFFPSVSVNAFINCVEHVLRVPLTELTTEEERHFIKFYQLPTDCLRCRKLITFENLKLFYPHLQYSFRTQVESQTATSSQQQSVPLGTIGVKRPDAVKRNIAPVSVPTKPNVVSKRRKICSDVILIDD